MERYLVDTNILIGYLRREKKAISFLDSLEKIVISAISAAEIYHRKIYFIPGLTTS